MNKNYRASNSLEIIQTLMTKLNRELNILLQAQAWKQTETKIHNEYSNVLKGNGCFKCTFSLQVKGNTKPYQVPLRHIAYTLQKPF